MSKKKIARKQTRSKLSKKTTATKRMDAAGIGDAAFTAISALPNLPGGADVLRRLGNAIGKLTPSNPPPTPHVQPFEERIQTMPGEELAKIALEGYGDGPLAYAALMTLSAELDALHDAIDGDDHIKTAVFAMAHRARVAAELDRRAAQGGVS